MATAESSSAKDTKPLPPIQHIRRAFTIDESTRRSSPGKRFASASDSPSLGVRRRSSNFSDYSIHEARKSFQSSTDDLLLPRPSAAGYEASHESSSWHSAPLAFALLPALGGMLFKNGSSVITDIMLLGMAAIFLNWSVRLPWDWYHSAQLIRLKDGEASDMFDDESEDENAMSFSHTTLDEVPEDEESEATPSLPKPVQRIPAHKAATNELYTHEILALLSCFVFPLLGAYLLHTLRSQLSRPSEGLVSNYNLTIFLLASELRPVSHLMKLIQSRTLHLQRVVNTNPYTSVNGKATVDGELRDVVERLNDLESRTTAEPPPNPEPVLSGKQSATLTTEVRKTLQPELDALNRAVRRYEKRATLQAFQTESRLLDLESRLADAISLAAAAANNGQRNRGFTGIVIEWAATAIVLPIQALGTVASLPFKTTAAFITYGKAKILGPPSIKIPKVVKGKFPANGRSSDRPPPAGRLQKK